MDFFSTSKISIVQRYKSQLKWLSERSSIKIDFLPTDILFSDVIFFFCVFLKKNKVLNWVRCHSNSLLWNEKDVFYQAPTSTQCILQQTLYMPLVITTIGKKQLMCHPKNLLFVYICEQKDISFSTEVKVMLNDMLIFSCVR